MNNKTENNENYFDFEAKIAIGYQSNAVLMSLKSDNKDVENGILKSIHFQGALAWLHHLPSQQNVASEIGVYLILGKAKADERMSNDSYSKASIFKIAGA